DRLGLLDLAERPSADVVGGRETDPDLIEEVHVKHVGLLSLSEFLLGAWWGSEPRGSDLLHAGRLTPGQVDAEFFGGTEEILFRVAHLDGRAVTGEHLYVETQ
ncbi:MAG: hypothetical protein JWQ70_1293, partial [Aeromicrobium sp.]|nr:hypothetical protein [Aeromicrobium sp.]